MSVALAGAALGWPWALPLIGLVLTIATGPLMFPTLWRRHYGKFAFMWATLALVPLAALQGVPAVAAAAAQGMLGDYLSCIALLFSLYVVAGGILVTGNLRGTPLLNGAILALGTLMAALVGTTGATMILIRPLLRANAARLHNTHVVVFFIVLVANIGGALSPIGAPPLFLGFLHGVDFSWPALHLWRQAAMATGVVLVAFIALDLWFYRNDRLVTTVGEARLPLHLRVRGTVNVVLIAGIIGIVLAAARWNLGLAFAIRGTPLPVQDLLRDGALFLIAMLSLIITRDEHREANGFTWGPMVVLAILFAGLFACAVPVMAMLQGGRAGALAPLLAGVTAADDTTRVVATFWLAGAFSAVMNNAPAYLGFFRLAGGDAHVLMGPLASTLGAISLGAVTIGALTYIGNAPNLLVQTIALERGYKMPGFFGYMLWAGAILLPVLLLLTFMFMA